MATVGAASALWMCCSAALSWSLAIRAANSIGTTSCSMRRAWVVQCGSVRPKVSCKRLVSAGSFGARGSRHEFARFDRKDTRRVGSKLHAKFGGRADDVARVFMPAGMSARGEVVGAIGALRQPGIVSHAKQHYGSDVGD